jgi:hypothetical protein
LPFDVAFIKNQEVKVAKHQKMGIWIKVKFKKICGHIAATQPIFIILGRR